MNREEAIANLNMISVAFVDPVTKEQRKLIDDTFDMAIKALEQEPKTDSWSIKDVADTFKKHGLIREQEPCEDAIDRKLVCAFIDGLISDDGERKKGLEYIRNMPPVNPQPCEDAISRAEAVRVASGYCHPANVAKELANLPPVNPTKTGHWIEHPEIETSTPEYLMFYKCSECGDKQCFCKSDIHKKHFCNNCGAKMVEPQKSEDKG